MWPLPHGSAASAEPPTPPNWGRTRLPAAANPIPTGDEVTMDLATRRGTPDATARDLFGEGGDSGTERAQCVPSPPLLGVPEPGECRDFLS